MRFIRLPVFLVIAVLSAACGTLSTGQLATITSSFAEGTGDTASGAPPTVYDITKVVSRRIDHSPFGSYDTIEVELTFAQSVVLPAPGSSPSSTGAQLAFDLGFNTDLDNTTGAVLSCGSLGSWNGIDFFVVGEGGGFGPRLLNGSYPIVDSSFVPTGEAAVSVSGSVLTITVPLSALGGDDGQTYLGVFAGNRNGGTLHETDCAPQPPGAVVTSPGGVPRTGIGR
jgi:hypothetical protein